MDAPWRGLQAAGKQEQMEKFDFLINNGRANIAWQNGYIWRSHGDNRHHTKRGTPG